MARSLMNEDTVLREAEEMATHHKQPATDPRLGHGLLLDPSHEGSQGVAVPTRTLSPSPLFTQHPAWQPESAQ